MFKPHGVRFRLGLALRRAVSAQQPFAPTPILLHVLHASDDQYRTTVSDDQYQTISIDDQYQAAAPWLQRRRPRPSMALAN